jgi:hypothetical protein
VATTAQQRTLNHMGALMDYLVHHAAQIHYRQYRPMDTAEWSEAHLRAILDNGGDIYMDCSEGVYALLHYAGIIGPRAYGNTDTLYDELPHYHDAATRSPARSSCGATTRARITRRWCAAPTRSTATRCCGRWAQESDPRFISLVDETRAQRGRPYVFCSIAKL